MGTIVLVTAWLVFPLLPWRRLGRVAARAWLGLKSARPRPPGRPLEQIASDARRLRRWHLGWARGQSFMKYEAHRRAYDDVLAEACRALGIVTLLEVLDPGGELDAERERVEAALEGAGLALGSLR